MRRPSGLALVLAALAAVLSPGPGVGADGPGASPVAAPDTASLPAGLSEGWYARFETSMGTFVARLLPDNAPQATAHFAALAEGRLAWNDLVTGEPTRARYYDGMAIHRAYAGDRFELGDATGTTRGAPLMYVPQETGPKGFEQPYRLGLTRASLGRVSAAILFVTAGSLPWLNRRHPCFGEVVSGNEVVWSIATVKTNSEGKPIAPVVVRSVRVLPVGSPPPLPEPIPYTPPPPPTFQARPRPAH